MMFPRISLALFCAVVSISIESRAGEIFKVPDLATISAHEVVLIPNQEIPFLYHWTSVSSLKRYQNSSVLKDINHEHFLANKVPSLAGVKGLFSWNNPIGGMGVAPNEMYADKASPALIRLKMKSSLNVLIIGSDSYSPDVTEIPEWLIDRTDVIFHTATGSGTPIFREFIILKDNAIESVAADPITLRGDVQSWLARFKDGSRRDSTLYMSRNLMMTLKNIKDHTWEPSYGYLSVFESTLEPLAEQFLRTPVGSIPAAFQDPILEYCGKLLGR